MSSPDCDDETFRTWREARDALADHAAHTPMCPRYLGATARMTASDSETE